MKHPAAETLRRFIRGEGSPAENREVVAHFLRGCKICSKNFWKEQDEIYV